ncbi:RNA polymerase sigma-70 factor [Pedobacter yulinensis]|uniref:RNA polymerase sigma-70 factor n=1 Tax=Pedobacter yulinensis TaxID=2126353 RepID=A0A2T3HJB0_9SPHI|nr:RNA polymerase sigma-70 factor [Pedobacter yulinensis]PST82522.1 RNA polymerase sigma-70 factor [Pedobacter yulinensis]
MRTDLIDSELAVLLAQSSERAFREIYERNWKLCFLSARKRLNNEAEAEEIVQDIFCKLWRRRTSFTLTRSFENYFAVAVKFEVINQLARRSRRESYERQAASAYVDADSSMQETIDLQDLKTQLQASINRLPDKCRAVFRLRYEKNYSQLQIAETLHISEKTVEAHLSKARKTLKANFGAALGMLICFF